MNISSKYLIATQNFQKSTDYTVLCHEQNNDVHKNIFLKNKQLWMLKIQILTLPMSKRTPEEFLGYWEKILSFESDKLGGKLRLVDCEH